MTPTHHAETAAPMTEEQVVALMRSSASDDEWNANCDLVKAACGGYPAFWYRAVILSGVAEAVRGWGRRSDGR